MHPFATAFAYLHGNFGERTVVHVRSGAIVKGPPPESAAPGVLLGNDKQPLKPGFPGNPGRDAAILSNGGPVRVKPIQVPVRFISRLLRALL